MKISDELNMILEEIYEIVKPKKQSIFVVGCSSSEILNKKIGTDSNKEIGDTVFLTIQKFFEDKNVYLACQCCEHLNRALVVEMEVAEKNMLEIVSVVPKINAGGAFATSAFINMKDPVVVEYIRADFGLDIGNTLIGMHLKHVAVPIRLSVKKLGGANIVCANTRPKLIGGYRAQYNRD